MADTQKKLKQVCKCEKCGNEAEMIVTCSLEEVPVEEGTSDEKTATPVKTKGTGTCSHCGNESEIWVDI